MREILRIRGERVRLPEIWRLRHGGREDRIAECAWSFVMENRGK